MHESVSCTHRWASWTRTRAGCARWTAREYMPGLVGLNNMKANDYVNVVVQARARA